MSVLLRHVIPTAFLAVATAMSYQASAQDNPAPVARRPVDEQDYVLIKGNLINGTPGCLALAPDGSVRFVEGRPLGKDVTVARAETSRLRAFGRNWNFAGRSAELVRLDWGSDARA